MSQIKYEAILKLVKLMPNIKAYTLRLLLYLVTVVDDENWIQVTNAKIKEDTGMGSRAVTLAIKEAESLQLIRRYYPRGSLIKLFL